ncbi:MAG: hypothetical protein DMG88_19165 [Acidobacteria bacterium]|nr:MAG: hypothetical protein DMG88_19165 [Acidobacteriota bacterium]
MGIVTPALLWSSSALASDRIPVPEKPPLIDREKEIALALSAAPPHLRKDATVYVLESVGYVKVRTGSNGFTCMVVRDHPLNIKPTCWDREGTETIVPRVLREGELLMQGVAVDRIRELIAEDFRQGKFITPRRPGIAYMLSGEIRNYDPRAGTVGSFPPHVMFYAPNLTNADIGFSPDYPMFRDGMLPFIGYQGPHGYMIMVVGSHVMGGKARGRHEEK